MKSNHKKVLAVIQRDNPKLYFSIKITMSKGVKTTPNDITRR
jgi:hypothetical protein